MSRRPGLSRAGVFDPMVRVRPCRRTGAARPEQEPRAPGFCGTTRARRALACALFPRARCTPSRVDRRPTDRRVRSRCAIQMCDPHHSMNGCSGSRPRCFAGRGKHRLGKRKSPGERRGGQRRGQVPTGPTGIARDGRVRAVRMMVNVAVGKMNCERCRARRGTTVFLEHLYRAAPASIPARETRRRLPAPGAGGLAPSFRSGTLGGCGSIPGFAVLPIRPMVVTPADVWRNISTARSR